MDLTFGLTLKFNSLASLPLDLSTPSDNLVIDRSISFADGVAADQANIIWHDERTLGDAAVDTLELYTGSLTDPFGTLLTMTVLKLLYIYNTSTTNSLTIGPSATGIGIFGAIASDILLIKPLGTFLWVAPNVTGLLLTTNEQLILTHDSTDATDLTYEIVAVGLD